MFDNQLKRLGEYLTRIKFNKIRKVKTSSSEINNLNIIPSTMIKRGHYQSRASIGAEKPEIIRVLGPNKKRDKYFKLQDGTDKSEFEIENDYVFMETLSVEGTAPKKNIFEFEPIIPSVSESSVTEQSTQEPTPEITPTIRTTNSTAPIGQIPLVESAGSLLGTSINNILDNQKQILLQLSELSNKVVQPNNIVSDIIKPNGGVSSINCDSDILDVIRKIHINTGKLTTDIPVNIPLDYDLTKVQGIVDLFEFPIIDVIKTIVIKTISNPNNMDILIDNIVYSIHKSLTSSTIQIQPKVHEDIQKQPKVHETNNSSTTGDSISGSGDTDTNTIDVENTVIADVIHDAIDIDTDISSIDDFLNQFK